MADNTCIDRGWWVRGPNRECPCTRNFGTPIFVTDGPLSEATPYIARRPDLRRTLGEVSALLTRYFHAPFDQVSKTAPRGDGHTVLVLPAWCRGDAFTVNVRRCLVELGYNAVGWDLGVNWGPTQRLRDGALARLISLADRGPISIVGYSMGGLFARWLALQRPDLVRGIITVCSPIHDPAQSFWMPIKPFFRFWSGSDIAKLADDIEQSLGIPATILYSRDDGLVHYAACIDRFAGAANNIEVTGPHVLIASNPQIMAIVAQRLAR